MTVGGIVHALRFPLRRLRVRARDARAPAPPAGTATPTTSILFVCKGNICRSSMAEGIARSILARDGLLGSIAVASAGTSDYNAGHRPHWRARACMQRHGLSIGDLRARQLTPEDFARFDVIAAMDSTVLEETRRRAGHAAESRVVPFSTADIDDPVAGDDDVFERTYDAIATGCEELIARLAHRAE